MIQSVKGTGCKARKIKCKYKTSEVHLAHLAPRCNTKIQWNTEWCRWCCQTVYYGIHRSPRTGLTGVWSESKTSDSQSTYRNTQPGQKSNMRMGRCRYFCKIHMMIQYSNDSYEISTSSHPCQPDCLFYFCSSSPKNEIKLALQDVNAKLK